MTCHDCTLASSVAERSICPSIHCYSLPLPLPWLAAWLPGCLSAAVLCCAVLCCAVLCCAVLCCAVLCCAVLCCAVLLYGTCPPNESGTDSKGQPTHPSLVLPSCAACRLCCVTCQCMWWCDMICACMHCRYSDDPEVIAVASEIVLIYVLYMFTSAMMWGIRGNLNGCGKQAIAAKLGLFASCE
jgi:hypothetical protein